MAEYLLCLAGYPDAAFSNIFHAAQASSDRGSLGCVVATWADSSPICPLTFAWPGWIGHAAFSWNTSIPWDFVKNFAGDLISLWILREPLDRNPELGQAIVELGRLETWFFQESLGESQNLEAFLPPSGYSSLYQLIFDPDSVSLDHLTPEAILDQNIPIDIQISKLLDWLISRRHCQKTWAQQIPQVREKINSAIQDMPEHEGITKLLAGTYINYFHCRQIVEILKETEADTKNLFGRYGSQRMKDWQDVLKSYEKDNIYLAEAAQMLTRNVNFEIPALKKQITKCEQVQHECEKKEAECVKLAHEFKEKYYATCRQMGIEGHNVKKEIVALLKDLPSLYENVADLSKSLKDAVHYYDGFVKHFVASSKQKDENRLPLLEYIIEHGNTTTYEWRYGEPPVKIEEPQLLIDIEDDNAAPESGGEIDFGDSGDIDFGSPGEDDIVLETGDIDWGQIDTASSEQDHVLGESIDFSIESAGIVVEDAGIEGGVARDSEALTLLDYHKTRTMFTDQLYELEAFLSQRLIESRAESSASSFVLSQSDSSDAELQISAENLSAMLSNVNKVINALQDVKIQHLSLIRTSPRYVDRLANSLQQRLSLVDKMKASEAAAADKKFAAAAEQAALKPRLQLLIQRTKELQSALEADVSKRYNNRPVYITGAISSI
nr:EOG090X07S9 [Eulimnadia texana]